MFMRYAFKISQIKSLLLFACSIVVINHTINCSFRTMIPKCARAINKRLAHVNIGTGKRMGLANKLDMEEPQQPERLRIETTRERCVTYMEHAGHIQQIGLMPAESIIVMLPEQSDAKEKTESASRWSSGALAWQRSQIVFFGGCVVVEVEARGLNNLST